MSQSTIPTPDSVDIQTNVDSPLQPLRSIGLCFSGGGYRATSFSLGVLSYFARIKLDGKPLLENVVALSSVSGGTLAAVAYAKAAQEGKSFADFFQGFYAFLNEDKLLTTATGNLKDKKLWEGNHKRRSLINAFSLAYQELYYGEARMGDLMGTEPVSHVRDVCFNATEFSFGLAFRFQNHEDYGNYYLSNTSLARLWPEVKLADAVASSSCFPVGFAPMIMPDDYFANQQRPEYLDLKRLEYFKEGIGILDGGIVDNQGIGSMVLIDKRRKRAKLNNLDLFMVCDVGGYRMTPWQMDESYTPTSESLRDKFLNFLKKLGLRWWQWLPMVLGILMMVLNNMGLIPGTPATSWYVLGGILAGSGLILTAVGAALGAGRSYILNTIKSLFKKNVPKVLADDVESFANLNVGLLRRMITERLSTGMTMINSVFLRQIRRLNYNLIYSKEAYDNRRITASVYELHQLNDYNKNITPAPSESLKSAALVAANTGTTLWWNEEDRKLNRLDTLIACGQFTTCYNLLDYIDKLDKNGIDISALKELQTALKADWEEFNKHPLFAVKG